MNETSPFCTLPNKMIPDVNVLGLAVAGGVFLHFNGPLIVLVDGNSPLDWMAEVLEE